MNASAQKLDDEDRSVDPAELDHPGSHAADDQPADARCEAARAEAQTTAAVMACVSPLPL